MPTGPFEKWGLDFIGLLPKTARKNQHIIVATDYLTKWAEAIPIKRATQETAIAFIFDHIVTRFSCPLELVTDRGRHFINEVVSIKLIKSSLHQTPTDQSILSPNQWAS
jgi:hypothetical protein